MQAKKKELKRLYHVLKDLINENSSQYAEIISRHISGVKIIVSTLSSSSSSILSEYLKLNKLPVQLLIIDEAPQCYEPSILIPLSRYDIRKVVLIGDHKQLGPIIHD